MNQKNKDLEIGILRKNQHLEQFLKSEHINENGFKDIILQNNSLPEIDFNEIDLSTAFLNKEIGAPILINAITGGTEEAFKINRDLARIAAKYNIPIAVGSQSLALKSEETHKSYSVVREIIGDGIVISNLGAGRSLEEVIKVMDIVKADAIQLHLNVAQEICMKEGDRNFKGLLKNISEVSHAMGKPVIVKEVGAGISKEVAFKLMNAGIKYIDIGGKGGTNFIEIEDRRNNEIDFSEFYSWGIPTAASLIQCCSIDSDLKVICSGGITKADEIVKSLCVGAKIVGVSGAILKVLMTEGYEECEKFVENLLYKIKVYMLLLGARDITKLRGMTYFLKGELREVSAQFLRKC